MPPQITTIDGAGANHTVTFAINNLGVFAGEHFDAPGNQHGFTATPVRTPQHSLSKAKASQGRGTLATLQQNVGSVAQVVSRRAQQAVATSDKMTCLYPRHILCLSLRRDALSLNWRRLPGYPSV